MVPLSLIIGIILFVAGLIKDNAFVTGMGISCCVWAYIFHAMNVATTLP